MWSASFVLEVVSPKQIKCAGFMQVVLASPHVEYVICKKDGLGCVTCIVRECLASAKEMHCKC